MDKRNVLTRSAATCAALLAMAGPGAAQQGEDTDTVESPTEPRSCLNQSEIRQAKILDGRNIVFVTRFEKIYSNQLPKQCPGLRRNTLVNYPITNRRLCEGDRIQVLIEQFRDYIPGAQCPLGLFVPITEAELADLTDSTDESRAKHPRGRSSREAVTTEQVELPRAETPAESGAATPTE
jgi:hypothetical protein